MKTTHKATYVAANYTEDTNDISSNCNSITFDNYGEDDVKIFINDPTHVHTGDYMLLKSGKSRDFVQGVDLVIYDKFDIVFMNLLASKGVNVIKETFELLQ